MADTSLFQMLAEAQSKPSGAYADAQSAAGALNSIFGSFRAQKEYDRSQKIQDMLDQPVSDKLRKRIFGTTDLPAGMSFGGLKDLASSGVATLLKDPNDSAQTRLIAAMASGGDPKKFADMMKQMQGVGDEEGNVTLPPGIGSLINAIKPESLKGKSPDYLSLLSANLKATISNPNVSFADRQYAQTLMDAVNQRLQSNTGIKVAPKKAKPAATATSATAPASTTPVDTGGAIKKLWDFLNTKSQ